MSLDILRSAIVKELISRVDTKLEIIANQSFRTASVTEGGTVVPAQTMEEIGAKTLEMNSAMRAYRDALQVVEKAFDDLMKPPAQESEKEQPADKDDAIYG